MKRPFQILLLLFITTLSFAQTSYKPPRILIVLDGSANMQERMPGGDTKFKAAEKFILNLMDSVYRVNDESEFALRVYGHQYPASQNNCQDSKLEVAFSKDNYTQMGLRLASLKPKGTEAMTWGVQNVVANDIISQNLYNYTFILITSGENNCEEGVCTLSQSIQNKKLEYSPTIISLSGKETQYGCIGEPIRATDESGISTALGHILNKYQKLIEPRNRNYKSKYGTQRIIATGEGRPSSLSNENMKQLPLKHLRNLPTAIYAINPSHTDIPTIEKSNGFGYLKIVENIAGSDFALYYQQGRSFVLFDKLNIRSLATGQQVMLKAGNYKLVYTVQAQPNPFSKAKLVSIKNQMITEIKLN